MPTPSSPTPTCKICHECGGCLTHPGNMYSCTRTLDFPSPKEPPVDCVEYGKQDVGPRR